jgi:hypothetical protein
VPKEGVVSWRIGLLLCLCAGLVLVGISCIDESPTGPSTPPSFGTLNPGDQWQYQYVIDDSARYWETVLREAPVVLAGDTVYALDYYSDGQQTLTRYFSVDDAGRAYIAGDRQVSFSDTLVTIFEPPVPFTPVGTGPGETWTSVAQVRNLKISPSIPPDTLETAGYMAWSARVMGEERIQVPAFDEPVRTLKVQYLGEEDAWAPPEFYAYFWFAEGVGPVRTVDLTYGGQTVNDLRQFTPGK